MWLIMQKKNGLIFTKNLISIFIILKTLLYIYIYSFFRHRTAKEHAWPHHDISAPILLRNGFPETGGYISSGSLWCDGSTKGRVHNAWVLSQLQLGLLSWVCFGHIWCVKSVACPGGVHHSNHCKSLCEDLPQSFQSFFRCANKHTISFYDINMSR